MYQCCGVGPFCRLRVFVIPPPHGSIVPLFSLKSTGIIWCHSRLLRYQKEARIRNTAEYRNTATGTYLTYRIKCLTIVLPFTFLWPFPFYHHLWMNITKSFGFIIIYNTVFFLVSVGSCAGSPEVVQYSVSSLLTFILFLFKFHITFFTIKIPQ